MGTLLALFIAAFAFAPVLVDIARPPSAEVCAEDWNELAGSTQAGEVTSGGFMLADVMGFVAKRSYPGCSVVFVTERGRPWLSCIRTFEAADPRLTEWGCEGGEHWGRGRTTGADFHPNATVGSNGKLVAEYYQRSA